MPSLSALGEFKASFNNIAGEKASFESEGLPFDDLVLPDTEAVPLEAPPGAAGQTGDFPADEAQEEVGSSLDGVSDFNFSDFLNVKPDDLNSPPPDDETADEEFQKNLAINDELLSGLSDELETGTADFDDGSESFGDTLDLGDESPENSSDFETESAGSDFDFSDESPETGLDIESESFGDALDLGDENSESSLDIEGESFDDVLDLGDESPESSSDIENESAGGDFDFGDESLESALDIEGESFDDVLDISDESPESSSDIESESAGSDFDFGDESLENTLDIDSRGSALDLGGENADGSFTPGDVSFDLGDEDTGDEQGLSGEGTGDEPDLSGEDFDLGSGDTGDELNLSGDNSDFGSDNLDTSTDLPDFDLGAEDAGEMPEFELPEAEALESGAEISGDEPDLGGDSFEPGAGLPDFDIGTEDTGEIHEFELPESEPLESGAEISDDEISGGDISGTEELIPDAGEETAGAEEDLDLDSLNLGDETEITAGDGFESFNLGGEEAAPVDLGSETEPAEGEDHGEHDFTLPGIDDLFDKGLKDTKTKPAARAKAKTEDTEEVEEIRLSNEDLENLRKTLSGYPLNLRIACQELIAEQVLAPDQLSKLIRLLVEGAPAREAASLAGQILDRKITIPKGFEKSTGEALEAEQASFAYIFVHNFLPVLRLFAVIAVLAACVFYLGYRFIYSPLKAESIYRRGYERIAAGEYQRANDLFRDAFSIHRKKNWFYQYAEGFRDERRYLLAEEKYEELLRHYPRDKKGVLDYSNLQTNYLMNYEKAERILLQELLDFAPDDREGLTALGDNYLAWADSNPSRYADKYEDARFAYARLLGRYGWQAPVVERMLRYFIRTDNLKEILPLKDWFDANSKRQLSAPALAELGGYLLDKQLEKVRGVPDEYVESIEGVRAMLLQAVRLNPGLPEPHYHLARYYGNLGNIHEERLTLENSIRTFNNAREESVKRRIYRIDAHRRYANVLANNREFFPAEEQLVRGINLYEEYLARNLISPSPQQGRLYADLGDLEYFVKSGNMGMALNYYHRSEQNGWSPPEIQYRMGAAYYQLEEWKSALEYLFKASADLPLNRRLLFALGNAAIKRGDYFAAQGYYNRLLDLLENQRSRLTVLLPNDRPDFLEVGERIMMARNNAGVAHEALAKQTGNISYRSRALVFYAESARAWDAITRNPASMVRLRPSGDLNTPGINLGFLNANNALRPAGGYEPEIFVRIDKDVLEPSRWEELAPASVFGF